MADPIVQIPQPTASAATDHPDPNVAPQIPPPPQGAMDAPPANTPAPAGASDIPPQSTENGQDKTGGAGFLQYSENYAKGAGQSFAHGMAGAGELGNKMSGGLLDKGAEKIGDLLGLPKLHEGANPYESTKGAVGSPQNTDEKVGYGGESLLEIITGDDVLKGLSYADKLAQAAKVARTIWAVTCKGQEYQSGYKSVRPQAA